jgi:hypothetical protein
MFRRLIRIAARLRALCAFVLDGVADALTRIEYRTLVR